MDDAGTQELQNESIVIRQAGREAVVGFLESHKIFAVLRNSGKVVVFDTRIPIQLAFYALVEHDMLAAPLWDAKKCEFVGILTVTDFIDILLEFRNDQSNVSKLATTSIANIRKFQPFVGADSDCSLKQACDMLLAGADFLPVVYAEDMRVLATLTYTDILEHLVTHFREQRRLFDDTIVDLGIGTYSNLITIAPTNTLAEALERMKEHNLSALPVIDKNNKLVGMYSRSDITFLTKATDAEDAVRNLELTVSEISLGNFRPDVTTPDALRTCHISHTLQAIFESFAGLKFNRLCVVNDSDNLVGVVSSRDLVEYFLKE